MINLVGNGREIVIGDDCEILIQLDYEIDGTFTFSSDIFEADDLTVKFDSFTCTVESFDLSDIDASLTGTVNLLVLRLTNVQTALFDETKTYLYDVKQISPTSFQTHPVRKSIIRAVEALTI